MLQLVYVIGQGFSGSTLLALLLGAHPEIATVGEVRIAPDAKTPAAEFLCSCGLPLDGCPFWLQVTREMARRGHAFDVRDGGLHPRANGSAAAGALLRAASRGRAFEALRGLGLRLHPGARRELERTAARFRDFVEVVCGIAGGTTFVDATKVPERLVFLRRLPEIDLRVIHLVRDGRAVASSTVKHAGVAPEAAARAWRDVNRRAERLAGALPAAHRLRLRYEDLCADPDAALRRVHAFLGVAPAGAPDLARLEHHVIGNRMRLRPLAEIRADESWRTAHDAAARRAIERIVAPLNGRYGYDGAWA